MMLPDALDLTDELKAKRAAAGMMLLGLDFDGTLAPIVPRPDDATLPAATKPLLETLVGRADTRVALVSGRSLGDLEQRVGIAGIWYAGNHGLEISGPGVERLHAEAQAAVVRLTATARALEQHFDGVAGVIVEDKGLTLSVHFRMVEDPDLGERISEQVAEVCAGVPGLRLSGGKKVVEIRPDVDWHKGRALHFLRETLSAGHTEAPTIFIGDDRTDEDAFREVGDGGCAIYVGDTPPAGTAAHALLKGIDDVRRFLQRLT
jgi:trehalose 6-phosphate phosphatase